MVKFSDILIELLLVILFFITGVAIMAGTNYPFLIFIPFALYAFIHYALKRGKKISKYVNDDFKKLGYEIISERPLKLFESEVNFEPTILINNVPIGRYNYIRQFARIFTVKDSSGEEYELNTLVTKEWTGQNTITIKSRKRIQPQSTNPN